MAFSHHIEKKGMSLPSLIDIIFLLLIFSLVTLSINNVKVETTESGENAMAFELPEANVKESYEVDENLSNLLFQIDYLDKSDKLGPKVVYALIPEKGDSISFSAALTQCRQDSLFTLLPSDYLSYSDQKFVSMPACTLIYWAVKQYKDKNFYKPDPGNVVELRFVKDTEFRIVNFIMETCSAYGDTIPKVVLRTLMGKKESGI